MNLVTLKRTLKMFKMANFILCVFCHNFLKCDEENKTNTIVQEETGHFLSIWAADYSPATCPVLVLGPAHARPLSGASAVRQRSERKLYKGVRGAGGPDMEGAEPQGGDHSHP